MQEPNILFHMDTTTHITSFNDSIWRGNVLDSTIIIVSMDSLHNHRTRNTDMGTGKALNIRKLAKLVYS